MTSDAVDIGARYCYFQFRDDLPLSAMNGTLQH